MCGIVGWTDFSRDLSAELSAIKTRTYFPKDLSAESCAIKTRTDFPKNLSGESCIIKRMTDKLTSRGPDSEGYWNAKHVALGHRRLTVVDPEGGKQPMIRSRGIYKYVLVYNGELYNTNEIRDQLLSCGYKFEGWSDTEVLLNAYIEWGENCVDRLNGIFAFAVWDERKNQIFLARDRIGVKPLFYSLQRSSFIFASEIKALLVHPLIQTGIDSDGLSEIFIIGPARTPGHGVFKGIKELKPGHCMTFCNNGMKIWQYWRLKSQPHSDDIISTLSNVRNLLFDAIKRQLVSDVPLCVLMSGGLDSSAIAAVASEFYKQEGMDCIGTFSVDYIDNEKHFVENEFQPDQDSPWVKIVSDYLGTRHKSCFIETSQLLSNLNSAVKARDLPGMADIDSSLLVFCQEIKKFATVGLSGECADEVFGGYPWFYNNNNRNNYNYNNNNNNNNQNNYNNARIEGFPWARNYKQRLNLLSDEVLASINPDKYIEQRFQEAMSEVPGCSEDSEEDARMREMFYINLTRWMPTLLDRKDRMSMANGVELRVPYCDHRLVEYVWNIPWKMKFYMNREKGLLRKALEGILPEPVLWRKKSPYPKTHNPEYLEGLKVLLLNIIEDNSSPLSRFINKKALKSFTLALNKNSNIPWFGQLMNAPQLLAYFIQVNFWLTEYKISGMF